MADRAYIDGRLVMDSKQDLVDEVKRLRLVLGDAVIVLSEARSNHVAGSGPDMAWDRNKDDVLANAAALAGKAP